MRSRAGVGMTPPNVLGAANPASSVMISSTLGAPFGGTTRGAHHCVDSEAFCLITPANFGSGCGSCLPLIVVVAAAEPSSPVTCCAAPYEEYEANATPDSAIATTSLTACIRAPFISTGLSTAQIYADRKDITFDVTTPFSLAAARSCR